MIINLYDRIYFDGAPVVESPLLETAGRKIYGCGDAMLKSVNGFFEGRNYTVQQSGDIYIRQGEGQDKQRLSLLEKIQAFIGYYLKKFGTWLCPEIKQEHQAVFLGDDSYFAKKFRITAIESEILNDKRRAYQSPFR